MSLFRVIFVAAFIISSHAAEGSRTNSRSIYDLGRGLAVYVYAFDKWRLFDLDTGSDYTILDRSLTNHLGSAVSEGPASTPDGNSSPIQFFNGTNFYLAGQWTALPYVGVFDLSVLREIAGEPTEGFIGLDLLTNYVVSLDLTIPSLTLSTNLPFPLRTGMPLESNLSQLAFRAELSSTQNIFLAIDTGYSGAIRLNPDDWQKAFPIGPANSKPRASTDFAGTMTTNLIARLPMLKIGPNIYTNLLCDRSANTNVASALGLEFLRQHRLLLNYPDRLLNLQRVRPQPTIDHDLSGLGLKWPDPHGFPIVFRIAQDSPASQSGLQEGDEILSIQGKDPRPMGKFRIHEMCRFSLESSQNWRDTSKNRVHTDCAAIFTASQKFQNVD